MGKKIYGKAGIIAFLSRWYSLDDTTFSIEVTNRCSLACKGCWIFNIKERLAFPVADAMLKPSQMRRLLIFGRTAGMNKVQFVGGEPLLNRELVSFVKMARKFGFQRAAVTTNGLSSWIQYRQLMENGLTDLSFSVDGSKKDSHDRLRPSKSGKSSFDKTIENIRKAVKLGENNHVKVRINHTLYPDNFHEAEAMIKLSASLGVHSMRIHYTLPGDGITDDRVSSSLREWLINPLNWLTLVDKFETLGRKLGIRIYIPRVFGYSEVDRIPTIRPNYLQVRPDNTLLMCNTHDRLSDPELRWFARITGEDSLEINEKSIVYGQPASGICCRAIPVLIKDYPAGVRNLLKKNGGLGCIYLPSPLITND